MYIFLNLGKQLSQADFSAIGGIMTKLNPGDIAPKTGHYKVVDKKGRTLDTVSVKQGDRLPPTQSKDYYYEIDI